MQEEKIERKIKQKRYQVLEKLESLIEVPVTVLGFIWLILLIIEYIWGLNQGLQYLVYFIWIIFIIDFLLRFILAPDKIIYLKKNWLTAISLFVPALRVFRIVKLIRLFSLTRATRGIQLIRVLTSVNRGMKALRKKLKQRSFGYVLSLTLIVTLVGSAAIFLFEKDVPESRGIHTYGDALWWTAIRMTTQSTEYWPVTLEGRLLTFILSIYSFAVFGYFTAVLASYFIGRDAENKSGEIAGSKEIHLLRTEIEELKKELREKTL